MGGSLLPAGNALEASIPMFQVLHRKSGCHGQPLLLPGALSQFSAIFCIISDHAKMAISMLNREFYGIHEAQFHVEYTIPKEGPC